MLDPVGFFDDFDDLQRIKAGISRRNREGVGKLADQPRGAHEAQRSMCDLLVPTLVSHHSFRGHLDRDRLHGP